MRIYADPDDRLGKTMPFLFEIVANERNGLDVDKYVMVLLCTHVRDDVTRIDLTISCGTVMPWATRATFLFLGACAYMVSLERTPSRV